MPGVVGSNALVHGGRPIGGVHLPSRDVLVALQGKQFHVVRSEPARLWGSSGQCGNNCAQSPLVGPWVPVNSPPVDAWSCGPNRKGETTEGKVGFKVCFSKAQLLPKFGI